MIIDVTSYFQAGGHDVRPPLAAAYATAFTSCMLARRTRVTSLVRCVCLMHLYL